MQSQKISVVPINVCYQGTVVHMQVHRMHPEVTCDADICFAQEVSRPAGRAVAGALGGLVILLAGGRA